MGYKIIDNKKVEMTDDEFSLYTKIVKSYTVNNNRGEDLFAGLFVVNDDGIITMLVPPSKRQTSMEVWLFLTSLFASQHLRLMYTEIETVAKEMKDKMKEMETLLEKIKRND